MKTILITGSSRGIGKAIARQAAAQGYKVIVHGRTDSEELNRTHNGIKGSEKVFFDVGDANAVEKSINKIGHIDVLVNNAGVAKNFINNLDDLSDEKAIEEFRTNILGTLHCSRAVLANMKSKGRGVIINIGSIKGHYNLTTLSTLTYGATKAGVIAITKALAKTYPEIRICSVSPGYVETDQVNDWNEETFNRINQGTVLERMAKPEEIANLVLFLASDMASYATGADFLIDGGYSIKGK